PFLSEIRIMSFNFAPKGWAFCNGQSLPINQNQALFALLGTTFGGNGQTTFQLPNLQGQSPIHVGNGHILGEKGGESAHTVTLQEMPQHNHGWQASSQDANQGTAAGAVLGRANNLYGAASNLTTIQPPTIQNTGGSQPHNNMQPYLVLTFCIALQGIFPSPN
ncbi:MAG: tail fiber protein, partial [Actinomycetota bacterium]|nr:tail fiber protein [Actinomycetota bacterium]